MRKIAVEVPEGSCKGCNCLLLGQCVAFTDKEGKYCVIKHNKPCPACLNATLREKDNIQPQTKFASCNIIETAMSVAKKVNDNDH
jgi:hypothetical protein